MASEPRSRRRENALRFLFRRIDYERLANVPYRAEEFKLQRMRDLLDRLGNPHRDLKIIHIAGTKGKGSTASMIAAMLGAGGFRVGVYTSPHLFRVEERASIDGCPCGESEWVDLVETVRPLVESMDEAGERGPTFFEIVTALALLHFSRHTVDFVVLEVGLGGRLDSTNVCHPLVSVITSISYDHTKQLGTTLASIAAEKAGIIKPGVPVVSSVVDSEPRSVIARIAAQQHSALFQAGEHFGHQCRLQGDTNGEFDATWMQYWERVGPRTRQLQDLGLALRGRHQAANAAVALATIGRLEAPDWLLTEQAIRAGLSSAQCPARIEIVGRQPTVVIDVAHNVASVEALIETLDEQFRARKRRLLFATSTDKDARGMLDRLQHFFDEIVLTQYSSNPRSLPADRLLQLANDCQADAEHTATPIVRSMNNPRQAWQQILAEAAPDDLICVAGSSFIAAELYSLVRESRKAIVGSGNSF